MRSVTTINPIYKQNSVNLDANENTNSYDNLNQNKFGTLYVTLAQGIQRTLVDMSQSLFKDVVSEKFGTSLLYVLHFL